MKTTLYYFTGTGNSLWLAKQLQALVPESEIKSIARMLERNELAIEEKAVFVTPLYYYGLPEIVMRLIKKSDLSKAAHISVIVTHGGPALVEGGVIEQVESLLAEKGTRLDASFMQWMPGNFIVWYGAHPRLLQRFLLKNAERRASKIARIISSGKSHYERGNPLITRTRAKSEYPKWLDRVAATDEEFWTTDACNACGTCEEICPVRNIRLQDGTPQWQHACQQCLACIQYCPREAIQYKKVTQGRKRYRNPHVKVSEIIRGNQQE